MTTTTDHFLPLQEEQRLFTLVWQGLPGASTARKTLINNELRPVANFIMKYKPTSWFLWEDALQEAYTILAECFNQVQPGVSNPGAILYNKACFCVRYLYAGSITEPESLDEIIPGTDNLQRIDTLAAPSSTVGCSPYAQALYAALRRLPIEQQRAIRSMYQLKRFHPSWHVRLSKKYKPANRLHPGGLRDRQRHAFQALRGDQALREAVLS